MLKKLSVHIFNVESANGEPSTAGQIRKPFDRAKYGKHSVDYSKSRVDYKYDEIQKKYSVIQRGNNDLELAIKIYYPLVNVEDTEYQNNVGKWNTEKLFKEYSENVKSQLKYSKDKILFGGEIPLMLPDNYRQCDTDAFLFKRYWRRNGIHIYDRKAFNKILSSYITFANIISISW